MQQSISTADLCLINGEGTLHDDLRAVQLLVEPAPFCKLRSVSCYLINSVWQRNQQLTEAARAFICVTVVDRANWLLPESPARLYQILP